MGFVGGSSFGGRPVGRSGTAEKCRRGVSIHVARSRWQMGLFDSLKKAVSGISEPSADGNEGTQGSDSNNDEENKRILERYGERVKKINAMEAEIEVLNDDELKQRSLALRDAVRKKEKTLDEVLEEAFTLVREAAFRCLGLRHYDVQLMGGMALNEGRIAEMATGEGKTLVCTLPAYLNALSGESVFVVTVNDYLAKRDADLMGRVHRFLGLSVGLIQAGMTPAVRRAQYDCDITYVTNSELGFDYLRDNLAMTADEVVITRPFNFCVIDEADSILIDEARTPLIISGKIDAPARKYQNANRIAVVLERDLHYEVDEKQQGVTLTERGQVDCEQALGGRDLFSTKDPWINFILNAIKAKELFKKEVNYIIDNNEIVIIDEFTGRAMAGRRWGDGLHQAVEAKEGIVVASEAQTIASVSYQSFFSLFDKISGMTGTAVTEEKEFATIYGLYVLPIPTALPKARKDYPDAVFKNQEGKYRAIMREIALEHTKGRPLLVGTTSIEDSEMISKLLADVECPHEVLNAKPENVARESEIIAQAGRMYAITIATNMAGRGTDILLGGNPSYCAQDVLRAAFAEKRGIEVGSIVNDVTDLSDETAKIVLAAIVRACEEMPDLDVVRLIDLATEAVEDPENEECVAKLREAYTLAKDEFKEQLTEEREAVMDLGGLYVIGTNRHESRRIDNQLRGRSGRQGDSGASRFFLALDDSIFTVFGGEQLQKLMTAFRVDENTPIENKQVSSALDKAQSNVETYYYDIRKVLWDYDQLLATQRNVYYTERRQILLSDRARLPKKVEQMCLDTAKAIVDAKSDDPIAMCGLLKQFFPALTGLEANKLPPKNQLKEYVSKQVSALLKAKEKELEGVKEGFAAEIERYLILTVLDNLWKNHLRDMDYLRQVIGVRGYGSMNPLDEYSNEGYKLFTEMMDNGTRNAVFSLFQYNVNEPQKAAK